MPRSPHRPAEARLPAAAGAGGYPPEQRKLSLGFVLLTVGLEFTLLSKERTSPSGGSPVAHELFTAVVALLFFLALALFVDLCYYASDGSAKRVLGCSILYVQIVISAVVSVLFAAKLADQPSSVSLRRSSLMFLILLLVVLAGPYLLTFDRRRPGFWRRPPTRVPEGGGPQAPRSPPDGESLDSGALHEDGDPGSSSSKPKARRRRRR